MVLDLNLDVLPGGVPDLVVVVTLLERVEPYEGADDEDGDAVHDEDPVEDDEADGDMVPLYDCEYRYSERYEEEYTKHCAACGARSNINRKRVYTFERKREDAPVRSALSKVKFIIKFFALHTNDMTMDRTPAASSHTSTNAQKAISFLDTIFPNLLDCY